MIFLGSIINLFHYYRGDIKSGIMTAICFYISRKYNLIFICTNCYNETMFVRKVVPSDCGNNFKRLIQKLWELQICKLCIK